MNSPFREIHHSFSVCLCLLNLLPQRPTHVTWKYSCSYLHRMMPFIRLTIAQYYNRDWLLSAFQSMKTKNHLEVQESINTLTAPFVALAPLLFSNQWVQLSILHAKYWIGWSGLGRPTVTNYRNSLACTQNMSSLAVSEDPAVR